VFGAILQAGLLLGSDADLPVASRWGSASQAVAKVVAGNMFHGVLKQTVSAAFPTWDAGLFLEWAGVRGWAANNKNNHKGLLRI
jgi:hypothetical protein